MIFTAFTGNPDDARMWNDFISTFCSSRELKIGSKDISIDFHTVLTASWISRDPIDESAYCKHNDPYILMSSLYPLTQECTVDVIHNDTLIEQYALDRNRSLIRYNNPEAVLDCFIPPATPEHLFYCKRTDNIILSNDLRLISRYLRASLDPVGVLSLFKYSICLPELSLFQNIQRIPYGHHFRIQLPAGTTNSRILYKPAEQRRFCPEIVEPESILSNTLDMIIKDIPERSILYFSGGVDSGLLAARFAHAMREDITLFNFSFGPDDPLASLAESMARHLNLPFRQVMFNSNDTLNVLLNINRDYSYPFGDNAVIPMHKLIKQSLKDSRETRVVIDGSGADAAFGLIGKYPSLQAVYGLPLWIRHIIGGLYHPLRLWKYNQREQWLGHLEAWCRRFRQSLHVPLDHAWVVGREPLQDITFRIPKNIHMLLELKVRNTLQKICDGLSELDQFSLLDVIHVCAGKVAAKSFDPARLGGALPVYPYLDTRLINCSLMLSWEQKCHQGEAKSILKKLLLRHVPYEMVYRPKAGFIPPLKSILSEPRTYDYIRSVVLSNHNSLLDFCIRPRLEKMFARLEQGLPLSVGLYRFIWLFIFTSIWLEQNSKSDPSASQNE